MIQRFYVAMDRQLGSIEPAPLQSVRLTALECRSDKNVRFDRGFDPPQLYYIQVSDLHTRIMNQEISILKLIV